VPTALDICGIDRLPQPVEAARVDPLGGKLTLRIPLGEGTSLVIELPLEPAGELNGCGCAHLQLCRWPGISTREVLD
jgi:hypothetical protein